MPTTTQAIANGTLQRATPSDSASTKRVGAGSAAPKPSKIVLKVGTTPTSKPAVISRESSSTITGYVSAPFSFARCEAARSRSSARRASTVGSAPASSPTETSWQ